ncbi:tripartite tricarboxylate transporter substrate binding protein [Saccharopolyspora shandongensis]|uniref:tripartite tricarboxylate transporter substrate binding protein n=1 Tax=Saccharopolyspora shandongensis TaxID=418495 RepID=UPI003416AB21
MGKPATALAVGAAAMLLAACAQESTGNPEDYPSRSIRLISPFPAGSSNDTLARLYGKCVETKLGQSVLVENRGGGNGTIGMNEVIRAKPDGYTLAQATTSTGVIAPMLTPDAGYNAKSLVPIGATSTTPSVLLVSPTSPITSLSQLISADDHVVVATSGPATSSGLNVKGLVDNYGLKADQIAYGSLGEGQRGLAHGDYDLLVAPSGKPVVKAIRSGEVRVLAVTADHRPDYLAEVPTLAELGYGAGQLPGPGIVTYWAAPSRTHPMVLDKLSRTLTTCTTDEQVLSVVGDNSPDLDLDGPHVAELLAETEKALVDLVRR